MKILLFGRNGQVGWELERSLMPIGDVFALDRSQADLSKPDTLIPIFQELKPDVVINAAAYTAVDTAENDEQLAMMINAEAVGVLAEVSRANNALLIHYSTDYVFDGKKDGMYSEEDTPNPLNIYGKSKLAGENVIIKSDVDHLIFRTSWVFSTRGKNFLNTILRLARERDDLSIVADQIGTPTWARLIAEVTGYCLVQAIQRRENGNFSSGIYNLTAKNYTSWYEFAKQIISSSPDQNNFLDSENIKPITSNDYPTPAIRPLNSRLDITKLENHYSLQMPSWQETVKYALNKV